jgi:SAM-dependent methyltransferase
MEERVTSATDDPRLFGRQWAADYDAQNHPDPTPAVDFLAKLADGGRTLELASGTGRVTLPLAARGQRVEAIEASEEMVALMRAKPGGAQIPVVVGDMADVPVAGQFCLVFLVFNSLFYLASAARQQDCFRNVARVLAPDGAFVVEARVPDPAGLDRNEQFKAHAVSVDGVTLSVHQHDAQNQIFLRQNIVVDTQGLRLKPFVMRYCWPEQIDEMAANAGLQLSARYADWHGQPFDAGCNTHISVYNQK